MNVQTVRADSFTISGQPWLLVSSMGPMGLEGYKTARFPVTLQQDEDGFIVASCPAFPGCHSQGRTKGEAIANITEAIRGYIASMRKHGEPIPLTDIVEVEVAI